MLRRSLLAAPLVLAAAPARARNGCPGSRSRSWSATRRAAPPTSQPASAASPSSASTATPSSSTTRPAPAASLRSRPSRSAAPDGYTVGIGIMGQLAVGAGRAGLADPARPRQGACSDLQSGRRADGADRAHGRAVQDHPGTHRLRQGQSRQGELRLDRPRARPISSVRNSGCRSGRAEDDPRALSRRRAGHRRRRRRQCRSSSSPTCRRS